MSARAVSEEWSIPLSTAKEWVNYVETHEDITPRGRDRPLLVGSPFRATLVEELNKRAENDEAVKAL